MPVDEFEVSLRNAEEKFKEAKTKDDVVSIWKTHYMRLGHKALGRLLIGKTTDDLLERRYERAQ